jgi:CRP/FNR family transcriptional regulator, cyclic AMP receptor protein
MVDVGELKKVEALSVFSEKQLNEIASVTDKKSYKAKGHIYEHGDRAKYMFIVGKGLVSLRQLMPGDEVGIVFEMRERGEFFGAACVMKPQQYTLSAVCMEDTEVLAIDADKLFDLCDADPDLGYRFMKKIAQLYFERYKACKRQLYDMVKAPTMIAASPG